MTIGHLIALLLMLFAGLGSYFLPALVAWSRHHRNTAAIAVLNFFLGWTLLGWVIALIWAFTNERARAARPSFAPGGE